MIDRIRHDIQERLDALLAEADKLRRALVALDPRDRGASKPKAAKAPSAAKPRAKRTPAAKPATAAKPASARTRTRAARPAAGTARTAPGETRAKVIAALSADGALTAGEVATATGLARPTVSTTLSRLAKSGEVVKADRGYVLPPAGSGSAPAESGSASAS